MHFVINLTVILKTIAKFSLLLFMLLLSVSCPTNLLYCLVSSRQCLYANTSIDRYLWNQRLINEIYDLKRLNMKKETIDREFLYVFLSFCQLIGFLITLNIFVKLSNCFMIGNASLARHLRTGIKEIFDFHLQNFYEIFFCFVFVGIFGKFVR